MNAFFPDVSDAEWDDWRWQSRHRIRTLDQFEKMLELSDEERDALLEGGTMLPVAVSPYYMSLLDPLDPMEPLRRTVVPTTAEFIRTPEKPTIRWVKMDTARYRDWFIVSGPSPAVAAGLLFNLLPLLYSIACGRAWRDCAERTAA